MDKGRGWMYKKFVCLPLGGHEKKQIPIHFMKDLCVLDVTLIYEEEPIDLKGCNVRIEGVQSSNRPIFQQCEIPDGKKGRVLLTVSEDIIDFNLPLLCELLIEGGGGQTRWVFFYVQFMVDSRAQLPKMKLNRSPKVHLIAHRGLSSIAPENTIPAYELAGRYGYYGAECDIHETKDGEFVILHNPTLEEMTNGVGKISDYTLKELKQFTITSGHQIQHYPSLKLPTLKEYLEVCKGWGLVPVIEVKEIGGDSASKLLRLINQEGSLAHVVIISFSKKTLLQIRKIDESVTLQWLTHLSEENIRLCAKHQLAISCRYKEATRKLVDQAHQQGVLVAVWTVDLHEKMQELMKMGVDFITTNSLLYRQSLYSSKEIKSYSYNQQEEYFNILSPALKEKGEAGWRYREENQLLEVFDEGEFGNVLEIKLPPLSVGDVITVSFFYRGMLGDSIRAGLEYVEDNHVQEMEHSMKIEANDNWSYVSGQFIAMKPVSEDKVYYRVIIGPKAAGKSHFMIRDVQVRIDYM